MLTAIAIARIRATMPRRGQSTFEPEGSPRPIAAYEACWREAKYPQKTSAVIAAT